ncbi:MAG: hypothetical protein ACLVIP_02355 [Ruminococcus sp.]
MESKVQKAKKNADIAEENDGVTAEKIKFPLYVFPETMKTVDILYKSDNCSSRTEFMEKAIRFYCGYLLQNKPELVDYLASQLATLTEGIVKARNRGCPVPCLKLQWSLVRLHICLRLCMTLTMIR